MREPGAQPEKGRAGLRVLLVHERYQLRGGEDVVFEQERRLLQDAGHEVASLESDNSEIASARGPKQRATLAMLTIWSRPSARRVAAAARKLRADVVHVHNTLPLLSPSILGAARGTGAAVVQTLHNYRLMCPSGNLFRDGHPCEDCLTRTVPWPGVMHACYRGSRAQTAVVAAMLSVNNLRRTWERDVDLFLTPTEFARGRFLAKGLPPDRVVVKPNFVEPDPGSRPPDFPGDGFVFVGRLTEEKGIRLLLEAWRRLGGTFRCRVVGTGPLATEVAQANIPGIAPTGQVSRDAVLDEMRSARALIFPSIWYETFGLAIVEAFACGVPVIAARLGAIPDVVEDGRTGLLFEPGNANDLARTVRWAADHPTEMAKLGVQARERFETRMTAPVAYRELLAAYALAIGFRRRDAQPGASA